MVGKLTSIHMYDGLVLRGSAPPPSPHTLAPEERSHREYFWERAPWASQDAPWSCSGALGSNVP